MDRGIYILKLKNNKYYVGKSENIQSRINDHITLNSNSANFIKHNNMLFAEEPITEKNENLFFWELSETIERMIKHGFNNVRGWEFSSINNLTHDECLFIKKLIIGLHDRCRNCGNCGHFSKNCTQNNKAEWLINLEKCYFNKNKFNEISPTSKAKCQECKLIITEGVKRIGIKYNYYGKIRIKYYHENCYNDGDLDLENGDLDLENGDLDLEQGNLYSETDNFLKKSNDSDLSLIINNNINQLNDIKIYSFGLCIWLTIVIIIMKFI